MANKNILLIEPGYKNKYPPLGLMKLAQYHGPHGKRDKVTFIKGEDASVFGTRVGPDLYHDAFLIRILHALRRASTSP